MKLLRKAQSLVQRHISRPTHSLLFAFSGGSGAWPGMGRTLFRDSSVFRESIEAADAIVEQVLGWSAIPLFRGEEETETDPNLRRRNEIIQLGMLQIAQVELWRAEGVRPGGVIGVSLGEMIAPYAAGALSREDCARVLAATSQGISSDGSEARIVIITADPVTARRLGRSAPAQLDYLGSTSPTKATMICHRRDIEIVRDHLGAALVRDFASGWDYHTPRLILDRVRLEEQLRNLQPRRPKCPIYSSAAGGAMPAGAPFDARFFAWMVTRPFHYADALTSALNDGFDAIVSIGSQPIHSADVVATAKSTGRTVRIIDSMRANEELPAWRAARTSVRPLRIVPPPRQQRIDARVAGLGDDALFSMYEQLRAAGPVHHLEERNVWLLVGYEDVLRALNDAERFSSDMDELRRIDPVLLASDPPAHTAQRQMLARLFTPTEVARRTGMMEETAEHLLQPLVEGRELDIVTDFARPLAAAVVADLIGVDANATSTLQEAMYASGGDLAKLYAAMQEPLETIAARSAYYAQLRGAGLEAIAARSLLRLLWIAGTTPQHALASAILLLLEHDDVRGRVQADGSMIGAFVDEALRLRPPAHVVPRLATQDVVIAGTRIPRGAQVQLVIAAANRDPARFEDPATLRLDRASNPHLSFGGGVHRCVGAPLGRALLIGAMTTLFRVAPDFRAIQPLATIRYTANAHLRELEQLVIGR